ncbi:MAG: molybdopterin molybdenumtransferase MoeA [Crocinitomix sp.]|nr:molybdopterin molybdenumtransferase MoeA [Crocinitomix sp.]
MISIKEAVKRISDENVQMRSDEIALNDALSYVLSETVLSPISMPPFDQSAMDGYALFGNIDKYKVVGELKAGDQPWNKDLTNGEALRIFTGAFVPTATYAVVKQEDINTNEGDIIVPKEILEGANIRRKGVEIQKGQIALKKGTLLNAAAIGFLAGLGIQKVRVICKPKISVLITGNELVAPGSVLVPGEIYESNSITLKAAIKEFGFSAKSSHVKDDYQTTVNSIERELNGNNVLIITGGISVGDYDFVGKALAELDVKEIFYSVNQRPGKPMYFGTKEGTLIFGLPGNPAAVLTCFYMYILPALKKMSGCNYHLTPETATLKQNYSKHGDREYLLKARLKNGVAEIFDRQSSAMLSSFVTANSLLHLPAGARDVKKGDTVEVYPLW